MQVRGVKIIDVKIKMMRKVYRTLIIPLLIKYMKVFKNFCLIEKLKFKVYIFLYFASLASFSIFADI